MTPHRNHQIEEVSAAMGEFLNDSRVYDWLQGPPYPFLPEHGADWVKQKLAEQAEVVSTLQKEFETREIQQGDGSNGPKELELFDRFPFLGIREVTERDPATGVPLQDVFIGELTLTRYAFHELQSDGSALALAQKHNDDLPAGHQDIVWSIGYYLSPAQHGRGVMSLAVRTALRDWAIPRMNLQLLKSSYFVGNQGSRRVLEKNNFAEIGTCKDWAPANPIKGRGPMSMIVVKWKGLG
ncbi:Acetyltransferase, GNAT family [Penicillium digitatum]|nr:Acetyltransferase, GNAT family [Penicillium digitatum]